MKRKYLIVSEGETDYEVLRAIIEEHANNLNWKVKVEPVFPGIGRHKKNGGWSNLRNWCIEQSNDLSGGKNLAAAAAALGANPSNTQNIQRRKDKIAAALILQAQYSYITFVFQLDTDVAESYIKDTALNHLAAPLDLINRRLVGEAALDAWLGLHSQKKNSGILYCISTHATETFLLANHDTNQLSEAFGTSPMPNDYDYLPQPDFALLKLGYSSELENGVQVLRKKTYKYKEHSRKFSNNLNSAITRSTSLNIFVNLL